MFCFNCKSEHSRGITHCPRCGSKLVYRFPSDPAAFHEPNELVIIGTFYSTLEADLARMALTAAGIESVLRANDSGAGVLPHLSFIRGIEILVRSLDAEDAEAILRLDLDSSQGEGYF